MSDQDYDESEIIDDVSEVEEAEEIESTDQEEVSEVQQRSGYVDLSDLSEDKQKAIKARFGELTREKSKAQLELQKARAIIAANEQKQFEQARPKEVEAPDFRLAIENPAEFTRQYDAHMQSKVEVENFRHQENYYREQQANQERERLANSLKSYNSQVESLGVDKAFMAEAEKNLDDAGIAKKIGSFLLEDPQGAAIVKELGSDIHELFNLSGMTPVQIVSYIERNIRPKLSTPKKQAAPSPVTKVTGSRGGQSAKTGRTYY